MTPDRELYHPDLLNPGRGIASNMQCARTEYLDGGNVEDVCKKHGVARSTFFARGAAEGWLRKDRKAHARLVEPAEPTPLPPPAPPTATLAAMALDRAADAILNGHVREAEAWTRVTIRMRKLAQEETTASNWLMTLGQSKAAEPKVQLPEPGLAPSVELTDCSSTHSSDDLDSPESLTLADAAAVLHEAAERRRAAFEQEYGEPPPTTNEGWTALFRRKGLPDPTFDDPAEEWDE